MSRTETTEQHEQAITAEARGQHAVIIASLKAGAPNITKLIFNALGEYVADDNALEQLLVETARGGNPLQQVINDLAWAEAERRAEAEMARREREGRAADEEARRDRATWERQFA